MSSRFELATPRYRLRTNGIAHRITPSTWDGAAVADAVTEALSYAARGKESVNEPIVVGLIPFDKQQPATLYVPNKVQWSAPVQPARTTGPPLHKLAVESQQSGSYEAAVAVAVDRIRAGLIDKVVLARRVTLKSEDDIDRDQVYARLLAQNNQAFVYRVDLPALAGQASPALIGASPELLLASTGSKIVSEPLAGSAPRADDSKIDKEVGQRLRRSQKDMHEHSLVVRSVGDSFRQYADNVVVPKEPSLVQTPVLWHLGTRITGVLRPEVSPVELAYELHPTPAVGGWPRHTAGKVIHELEDFDRGFYSGLLGWMDSRGNSEWVLVLRGGVVDRNTATLFAGAGIVANSSPEREREETSVKLRTLIDALGTPQSVI